MSINIHEIARQIISKTKSKEYWQGYLSALYKIEAIKGADYTRLYLLTFQYGT